MTALTTLDRPPLAAPQAQQANDIAGIGMEGQVGVGLVAAHVKIAIATAVIEDVSQQVALGVLGDRLAEMQADAPEDRADILVGVILHVEAPQQKEATAGGNVLQPGAQLRRQGR